MGAEAVTVIAGTVSPPGVECPHLGRAVRVGSRLGGTPVRGTTILGACLRGDAVRGEVESTGVENEVVWTTPGEVAGATETVQEGRDNGRECSRCEELRDTARSRGRVRRRGECERSPLRRG